MKKVTRDGVIAAIRKETEGSSLRQAAKRFGISAAYLSDILRGNREISDRIAAKFGFTREVKVITKVVFRKVA